MIIPTMPTPTSLRYEQEAQRWFEAGRPADDTMAELDIVKLNCWIASDGAKGEGVSNTLKAYVKALMAELDRRHPNWLDDLFSDRESCRICGTSWRGENMSLCTYCSETFPPCHKPTFYLSNGNLECPHCKQGEIVG